MVVGMTLEMVFGMTVEIVVMMTMETIAGAMEMAVEKIHRYQRINDK